MQNIAIIVCKKNDKFLILKRAPNCPDGGLWNFPGGKFEPNETGKEAAARELKEETNLDVLEENLRLVDVIKTDKFYLNFFKTDQFSGELKINKESSDYAWVTEEEIKNYKFIDTNNEGIDE
jgi:8-oxo-dGTP diphosphatase